MTTGAVLLALSYLAAAAVSQHWSCSVMNIVSPMEPVATRAALDVIPQIRPDIPARVA